MSNTAFNMISIIYIQVYRYPKIVTLYAGPINMADPH